jgi:DNA-binding transcriptional ArsR family regulator
MDKYSKGLNATFFALGDPTRRAILGALSKGQASVSELAKPHKISLPAVMKHLRVLEDAGLVSQHKTGRVRHCRLTAKPLLQASDWLSEYQMFWEKQFDALDRYLKESQATEVPECHKRKFPRPSRS